MRIATVVLVAVLYALGTLRATEVAAVQRGGPLPSAPEENQAEVEELKASVVKIVSKAPEGQPRTGTGFVVSVDGDVVYIATAAHVITGDRQPQVFFYYDKRRPVPAEIGELETDNLTAGLGFLIVRDRAVAKQVDALGWSTGNAQGRRADSDDRVRPRGRGLGCDQRDHCLCVGVGHPDRRADRRGQFRRPDPHEWQRRGDGDVTQTGLRRRQVGHRRSVNAPRMGYRNCPADHCRDCHPGRSGADNHPAYSSAWTGRSSCWRGREWAVFQ